jgi:hypothetical protein
MITKPIFPFRSTPITSLFHYSLNGAQLPVFVYQYGVGCWRINHAWVDPRTRMPQFQRRALQVGTGMEEEPRWHDAGTKPPIPSGRGVHTAQGNRGFDSISPTHAGPGVTWEAGRGQKSRERDMPTAPCARERNIASRLPPFGPSATPADTAQTYDSGGGGLALRYPGPIPLRCPLSTTGINPSVFETA